jgi:rhodanese-related sulfurtransferase
VDDLEVRAAMTASWLRQMGWPDVAVLVASGAETGWPAPPVLSDAQRPDTRIDAAALAGLLDRDAATVIDVSSSRAYRAGHIADAWFAIRSRLERALARVEARGTVVLTSEDGILAALAVDETRALTAAPVRWLGGGNAGWTASGRALTAEAPRLADEPLDAWLKPYEPGGGGAAAMREYLSWEVDLLRRIERDGSCRFHPLGR